VIFFVWFGERTPHFIKETGFLQSLSQYNPMLLVASKADALIELLLGC